MSDELGTGRTLPITVVIPAYNSEGYITAAIASVLAQTRAPAEILVIDDGSTDSTAASARALGARVVVQSNQGPAAARNVGIREAHQAWIAFLDADDTWTRDKLDRQWAAHERCPQAPILISDYALVRAGEVVATSFFALTPGYLGSAREAVGHDTVFIRRDQMLATIVRTNIASPSTMLLDRAWLLEHDLRFAESLPASKEFLVAEDFEWLLRALRHGDVVAVERPLTRYTLNENGRSASKGRQACGDVMLGELIARAPGRYAERADVSFRRARPVMLRRAALEYLRQSDYTNARRVLRRALREGASLRTLALMAPAAIGDWRLGRIVILGLRALWRHRHAYRSAPTIQ